MPFLENKLKAVSVQALEEAIAKAVSELVGGEYECAIANLNFGQGTWGTEPAQMKLSLSIPSKIAFGGMLENEASTN